MESLEQIKKKTNLEESTLVLEKLLLEIYLKNNFSTKPLARSLALPVPVVAAIKKEMVKSGYLINGPRTALSKDGTTYIRETLGYEGLALPVYLGLMNENIDPEEEFEKELEFLEEIMEGRPGVDVTLDQSKGTPETALNRGILALKENLLIGKPLLCLGDDDLVSIGASLVLKRLFPQSPDLPGKIMVIDIDRRFLDYIESIASKYNYPITCINHDLRQPLPEGMVGKFAAIMTDPPYTIPGLELFLSRGISALEDENDRAIFLSFPRKSTPFQLRQQELITRMGLVITHIYPAFNQYEGAEMLGNQSDLYFLKTTLNSKPLITEEFSSDLYTGELRKTIRFYLCKGCGKKIKVGSGESFTTIEELKKESCPDCGGEKFNIQERINRPPK